ncbi:MAG: hypothetical protein A3F84_11960 [Candidatus Handelsmanbacteria bacterium RIFCSPLOWO2_12_FULL_64_10]|uniref:Ubiquitin Mut7-C domain-containing protein n=1 Tax=Handelsmanbacteria sp. (strain RIFCSPLOWO2_12_FULL_64_10) TaxID=1817868 RepID=A0A1F6CLR0_HANXR|nr:MAG: hypothetical protein A3F84_11960 [Candidatus Handelsmanbacteria bacterium RIFCSPLOWO2_12_FULL_64_10]
MGKVLRGRQGALKVESRKSKVRNNMDIEVRLFATLAKYLPPGSDGRQAWLTVAEGTTAGEVLDRLGIPRQGAKLIFIDSVHRKSDTALRSGNVLSVFPPIAGGQGDGPGTAPGARPAAQEGQAAKAPGGGIPGGGSPPPS